MHLSISFQDFWKKGKVDGGSLLKQDVACSFTKFFEEDEGHFWKKRQEAEDTKVSEEAEGHFWKKRQEAEDFFTMFYGHYGTNLDSITIGGTTKEMNDDIVVKEV